MTPCNVTKQGHDECMQILPKSDRSIALVSTNRTQLGYHTDLFFNRVKLSLIMLPPQHLNPIIRYHVEF